MVDSESAELNALLKRLLDPSTQSEQLDKPNSPVLSKRPRNKRKAKQPNAPTKPCYNPPIKIMNPCTRKGNYFLVQEIKMTMSSQNRHQSNSRNRSQEKIQNLG